MGGGPPARRSGGSRRGAAAAALVGAAGLLVCNGALFVGFGPAPGLRQVGGARARGPTARHFFNNLFGGDEKKLEPVVPNRSQEPEVADRHRQRFLCYAEGEGDNARLSKEGLRSLLECTESFCLSKHWLDPAFVEHVYDEYAEKEGGISIWGFNRIEHDGLLLEGQLEEYEKAFSEIDAEGTGVITREQLGQLFAGLGRIMAPEELDKIVDEADVGHDGIDLADFLGLARTHLSLREIMKYFTTNPVANAPLPVDLADKEFAPDTNLGELTVVHGEAELNAIIANKADTIVKLAFTWCRPCKGFLPRYEKYAKLYKNTRFLKIVGNENQSTKHYARDVLKAKISPMFAVYRGGELVDSWSGANNARFMENIEKNLPTAGALVSDREAAVAADESIAPAPPKATGKV